MFRNFEDDSAEDTIVNMMEQVKFVERLNEMLAQGVDLFVNNKSSFMIKNNAQHLTYDAESILKRAPRLLINNIDSVKTILNVDVLRINAFGIENEQKSYLGFVPPSQEKLLLSLQINKDKILRWIREKISRSCRKGE